MKVAKTNYATNIFSLLILYLNGIILFSLIKTIKSRPGNTSKIYLNNNNNKNNNFQQESRICSKNYIPSKLSSARDVILLFGTAFTSGLELAIKSLRSTGCNARVVLLTIPEIILTKTELQKLQKYEVEIYKDYVDPKGRKLVPHMIRYNYELKWLKEHLNEVDRVLHSDAYDIFFQSDPFEDVIHYDDIMFVVEPHFIRSCGWNLQWLGQCYGAEETEKIKNNFIICSGSIAGSVSEYIKLLELMISQKEWESCYDDSKDQPILNYLMWNGIIDDHHIKYRLTGCDAGFMTIQWCVLNREIKLNQYGQILSPANATPPYLHQYPRIDTLSNYLFKACGIEIY